MVRSLTQLKRTQTVKDILHLKTKAFSWPPECQQAVSSLRAHLNTVQTIYIRGRCFQKIYRFFGSVLYQIQKKNKNGILSISVNASAKMEKIWCHQKINSCCSYIIWTLLFRFMWKFLTFSTAVATECYIARRSNRSMTWKTLIVKAKKVLILCQEGYVQKINVNSVWQKRILSE